MLLKLFNLQHILHELRKKSKNAQNKNLISYLSKQMFMHASSMLESPSIFKIILIVNQIAKVNPQCQQTWVDQAIWFHG